MLNRSGIYKITCTANGRIYIGSAVAFRERWTTHRSAARGNRHHSKYMQNSWKKYGEVAFKFEILFVCSREDLLFFEQRAIDSFQPEFNSHPVAGTPIGYKHTDEALANMRIAQSKVDRSNRVQHRHTEDTKKKLSEMHMGASNPMYGKTVSEDTRKKLSAAHKGRKVHENTREGARRAKQKQWSEPEYRAKMMAILRNRKPSKEAVVASAVANGVPVTIGCATYHSTKEAARAVGRHESTLMTWVRRGVIPPNNGEFTGLAITRSTRERPEFSRKESQTKAHNPVIVGEMQFSSRAKAAAFFGVCTTTITRWVERGKILKPRKPAGYDGYIGLQVRDNYV